MVQLTIVHYMTKAVVLNELDMDLLLLCQLTTSIHYILLNEKKIYILIDFTKETQCNATPVNSSIYRYIYILTV